MWELADLGPVGLWVGLLVELRVGLFELGLLGLGVDFLPHSGQDRLEGGRHHNLTSVSEWSETKGFLLRSYPQSINNLY